MFSFSHITFCEKSRFRWCRSSWQWSNHWQISTQGKQIWSHDDPENAKKTHACTGRSYNTRSLRRRRANLRTKGAKKTVKESTTTEGFLFFKRKSKGNFKKKDNYEMKVDLVRRRRRTTRLYLFEMLAKGKISTASRELPQLHHRNQNSAQNCTQKRSERRSVVMGCCCREGRKYKASKWMNRFHPSIRIKSVSILYCSALFVPLEGDHNK